VYVPFDSEKVNSAVVEVNGRPSTDTDQAVPEGSPDSVNVKAKVDGGMAVKVTGIETAPPSTVTDPDDGLTRYPGSGATVYP
jgi:hypothetical protein